MKKFLCMLLAISILSTAFTTVPALAAEETIIYGDISGNGRLELSDLFSLHRDFLSLRLVPDEDYWDELDYEYYYHVLKACDVDGDNSITMTDIYALEEHMYRVGLLADINYDSSTGCRAGDVTRDGAINARDVFLLYEISIGNISDKNYYDVCDFDGNGRIDMFDYAEFEKLLYSNTEIHYLTSTGVCGEKASWVFDEKGTLTICGSGAMDDWSQAFPPPWYSSRYSITSVVIEDGITTVGNRAFSACTQLLNITIPDSVTSIGDFAIHECYSLSSITMPDSLTNLGDGVFRLCSSLDSITIPNGVTSIGYLSFSECFKLSSITIPDSVTSIGDLAFFRCKNLKSVTIPNSITAIGDDAFAWCDNLTDIFYLGTEEEWESIVGVEGNEALENATVHYGTNITPDVSFGALSADLTYSINMYVGETHNLKLKVKDSVWYLTKWFSHDPKIATVDSNGQITAKQVGSTTIQVTITDRWSMQQITKKCTVTVKSHSLYDYTKFKYTFVNSKDSFSSSDSYKIPIERYEQAGLSKDLAEDGWGGNCFGMSTSSILFFKDVLHEERYKNDVHTPSEFAPPNAGDNAFLWDKWEVKLRHMIELFQIAQYRSPDNFVEEFSHAKIARELDKGNPVALGIRGTNITTSQIGEHLVVIYGYTLEGGIYTFKIYDCSYFISDLIYNTTTNRFAFRQINTQYDWHTIMGIISFETINNLYNDLYKIGNNSVSLFSTEQNTYTYIKTNERDLTLTNSQEQSTTITNATLVGDIENARVISSSYLAEKSTYTIILPMDKYTIMGSGNDVVTTSIINDNKSVTVTDKANIPLTVSNDLKTIELGTYMNDEYTIKYKLSENLFDEIVLSGNAADEIKTSHNNSIIYVSGAKSITVTATVSEKETTASAEIPEGKEAIIKFNTDENGNTSLQIVCDNEPLTDTVGLAEREQLDLPVYDLESGPYEEGQTLTFTKDSDTIIYYTTDGSVPSADNGIIYSMPIEINKSMNIKAVATKFGYLDSDILELNYTLPDIMEPVADYNSGEYAEVITVRLRAKDNLTDIYYTMDGSDPFENGELYTIPLVITKDCDIRAYAVKNGVISDETEYNYTINSQHPLYLMNTPTNQDGELITGENISELTKINLVVEKLNREEVKTTVLVAFYDEGDKLLSVELAEGTITEETGNIEVLVDKKNTTARKMKVYMWNSLNLPEPLSLTEEFIIS